MLVCTRQDKYNKDIKHVFRLDNNYHVFYNQYKGGTKVNSAYTRINRGNYYYPYIEEFIKSRRMTNRILKSE